MPTLHHPQPDFTGTVTLGRHRVQFEDGTGHTDAGVPEFARAGFTVTPTIESGGETVDLDALKVVDLRDMAKTEGVDLDGATRKADIIAAITAGTPSVTPEPLYDDAPEVTNETEDAEPIANGTDD